MSYADEQRMRRFKPRGLPKYDLLHEAYAILGGIPDESVHLQRIITEGGMTGSGQINCKTVACGAGWLALHPMFRGLGLGVCSINNNNFNYEAHMQWKGVPVGAESNYHLAMAPLFNMTLSDAENMFSAWRSSNEAGMTDKERLLKRIYEFLREHGETTAQRARKQADGIV